MKLASSFTILLFCFISTISFGQTVNYEPLFTTSTFDAVTPDVSLVVGATNGSASVNSGVAGYTIPIVTPPSTNNVAPSVSLVYSSMAGNGIMGQGWNVSGLSAISRTGHNIYFDGDVTPVDLSVQDRFSLDGARLIGLTGTYGADGTQYGKESEDFSRITSYVSMGSGLLWFELVTKDGVKMEYGHTSDSRFLSEDGGNVLFWKLNRVTYRDGNYIEYKYSSIPLTREHQIDEIKFTGNTLAGIVPYNKVKFVYEERDDKNTVYLAGQRIGSTHLLTSVQVLTENDAAFRSYDLSYAFNGTTSFLTKVTEKGSDGSALNPTVFKYGETNQNSFLALPHSTAISQVVNEIYIDYNLDGKPDMLGLEEKYTSDGYKYYPNIHFYKNVVNANGTDVQFQYDGYLDLPQRAAVNIGDMAINNAQDYADFDGNGKPNIIVSELEKFVDTRKLNTVKIYEKTQLKHEFTPPTTISTFTVPDKPFMFSGDFDGDGKSEILFY